MPADIISLTDLIESRLRKEQELEYYLDVLTQLESKITYLRKEVSITNLIIDMIDKDKILEVGKKDKKADIIRLVDHADKNHD